MRPSSAENPQASPKPPLRAKWRRMRPELGNEGLWRRPVATGCPQGDRTRCTDSTCGVTPNQVLGRRNLVRWPPLSTKKQRGDGVFKKWPGIQALGTTLNAVDGLVCVPEASRLTNHRHLLSRVEAHAKTTIPPWEANEGTDHLDVVCRARGP
jgi:hypothetical protein